MEPIVNIVGERVALGPIRRDLIPLVQRWMNDFTVRRSFGIPEPTTVEQQTRVYDYIVGDDKSAFFTIYERDGWRPIGYTYLEGIIWRDRTAEFGILIGEADARGKGYGTEATMLLLDYAFAALGLHSVILRVYAYNFAGKRAYEKAGFREFGRRRESKLMGGRLWDQVYMECLASEFTSPVLAPFFAPDEPR
ncbi:MAG: GNAT family N-acetyltransferase [Thermomicrobiales bacterium]